MVDEVDEASGWDSIEAAFSETYGGVQPVHFAPGPPPSLGGVVSRISAYEAAIGCHFVSFGRTELFGKESDDAEVSGWAYELTLRSPAAPEPQGWAVELLLAVAQVTQQRGVVFADGHRLDVGGAIGSGDSALRAVAF